MVNMFWIRTQFYWSHWKFFVSYESESKNNTVRILPLLILFCGFTVCHLSLKSRWLAVTSTLWLGTKLTMKVCTPMLAPMYTYTHTHTHMRREGREREKRGKEDGRRGAGSSKITWLCILHHQKHLKGGTLMTHIKSVNNLHSFLLDIFSISSLHPPGMPHLSVWNSTDTPRR